MDFHNHQSFCLGSSPPRILRDDRISQPESAGGGQGKKASFPLTFCRLKCTSRLYLTSEELWPVFFSVAKNYNTDLSFQVNMGLTFLKAWKKCYYSKLWTLLMAKGLVGSVCGDNLSHGVTAPGRRRGRLFSMINGKPPSSGDHRGPGNAVGLGPLPSLCLGLATQLQIQ